MMERESFIIDSIFQRAKGGVEAFFPNGSKHKLNSGTTCKPQFKDKYI